LKINSLFKLKTSQNEINQPMAYFLLFVFTFALMAILQPRRFLSSTNIEQLAFQIPEFGLFSIGMMVAMISGGIDLSMITTANLSGIISAIVLLMLSNRGTMDLSSLLKGIMADDSIRSSLEAVMPTGITMIGIIVLTVLVALTVGLLCGLLNGFLVAKVKIPPILATLGTMRLYEGISLVITKGAPLTGFPDEFIFLGSGKILGIPTPMIIFILAIIAVDVLMVKTPLGRGIYAVGENPLAARYSGLDNSKILMRTYAVTGLLAGLAAVVTMARTDSIKVGYGSSYQLQSILVVILGGVSTVGGTGSIIGVVFSVLILRVIGSGFNIMGFSNYMRNVIWGALLIVVAIVLSSGFRFKKRSRRIEVKPE
jgi:simple sugar transport system permease protein